MIYSLPYITLVLFYAMLSCVYTTMSDDMKRNVRIVCVFVYIVFFGFRGYVGDDWTIYYPTFADEVHVSSFQDILFTLEEEPYEIGFTILMIISKLSFDSFPFFVFFVTCINFALLYRFLRKRIDNIPLGIMLFLCMGGFGMQINLFRNTISILLFANAIEYLVNRKPIPYFLMCILALSFHLSAIIYFPLYFFFHKRFPRWFYVLVFVFGNIFFLSQIKFISPIMMSIAGQMGEEYEFLVEAYTEGKIGEINQGISIGYIERLLTGLLILCYYDKLTTMRSENAVFINSYLAYFFMYFFFSEFSVVAGRLATLFSYFYWIIWIDLLRCFTIRNNMLLFIVYLGIYSVLKMWGMTNLITLRYDNVLFGAQSYEERLYIHEKYKDDIKL